jgi:hypothetical protein
MVARLDALALALALLAGTMAIEDSHRVDAGAPDDGLVAAAPGVCEQDQTPDDGDRDHHAAFDVTVSVESGLMFMDTAEAPSPCGDDKAGDD